MELLHALRNTTARIYCHELYFADEISNISNLHVVTSCSTEFLRAVIPFTDCDLRMNRLISLQISDSVYENRLVMKIALAPVLPDIADIENPSSQSPKGDKNQSTMMVYGTCR